MRKFAQALKLTSISLGNVSVNSANAACPIEVIEAEKIRDESRDLQFTMADGAIAETRVPYCKVPRNTLSFNPYPLIYAVPFALAMSIVAWQMAESENACGPISGLLQLV